MADEKINEVLSSVFSNSELMDKISNIVKDKKGESKEDALPEIISAISEKVKIPTQGEEKGEMNNEKAEADSSSFFSNSTKNSAALLRAMKPFLGKERCEMVDNILKFEQLAELVKLTR